MMQLKYFFQKKISFEKKKNDKNLHTVFPNDLKISKHSKAYKLSVYIKNEKNVK